MKIIRILLLLILNAPALIGSAQNKSAWLSGKVSDEENNPLPKVSVTILGRQTGIITSDSGSFRLKVPAGKAFAVLFSYSGYRTEQHNFLIKENEEKYITIHLEQRKGELDSVVVTDQKK